jgi:hypothetical protein
VPPHRALNVSTSGERIEGERNWRPRRVSGITSGALPQQSGACRSRGVSGDRFCNNCGERLPAESSGRDHFGKPHYFSLCWALSFKMRVEIHRRKPQAALATAGELIEVSREQRFDRLLVCSSGAPRSTPVPASTLGRPSPEARETSEDFGQLRGDLLWCHLWSESDQHLPVPGDQELRKVPDDILFPIGVGIPCLEELVELASAVTIHLDLGKDREAGVVLRGGELENFGVGPRLLGAELIAGKAQNVEFLVLVVFM